MLIGIAAIIFLGMFAQWLAWRLRLSTILLLLAFGFLAGPITGWVDPDQLLGDLLFPIVSLAVGIILFEGGLGLRLKELQVVGVTVRNIVSIGALVTWTVCAVAAYFILKLDFYLALLLGSILIVSGPTVILPLLRDLRPTGKAAAILRWEGILIDPVGATVAVLVFDFVAGTAAQHAASNPLISLLEIAIIGLALGWVFARFMAVLLRRYLIPDHLQNATMLMLVIVVFALSNRLAPESGLLATTVMGMVLANQEGVLLKRIIEFKEDLGVVLVSSLFILLASRLEFSDFSDLGWEALLFLAVVILVARPLAVLISTYRSKLERRQRIFLASLAPRGIVAAAVSSTFALELSRQGYPAAEKLVPLTFLVIIGTVVIYGLGIGPLTRRLGLSESNPQGLLLVGAHSCAQQIGLFMHQLGFKVILVDTNPQNIYDARKLGLSAHLGNILHEEVVEEINLGGIGRMLALTSNDEVNSLAALHLSDVFGRRNVYQLAPRQAENGAESPLPPFLLGRLLFKPGATQGEIEQRFREGWTIQLVELGPNTDPDDIIARHEQSIIPMFLITANDEVRIFTHGIDMVTEPGQRLIAMLAPEMSMAPAATLELPETSLSPTL